MSRWADYVLIEDGEFDDFWRERLGRTARTVLIIGEGFDPRAATAPARIIEAGSSGLEILRVALRRSRLPNDEAEAVAANREAVDALAKGVGIEIEECPYPDVEDPKSAGAVVIRKLIREGRFDGANQVIVDVSALPLDVYFAAVSGLLQLADQTGVHSDLFVVGTENPLIDDAIVHESVEDLAHLPGFSGSEHEAQLRLWVPILGKGRSEEVKAIYQSNFEQRPDEICPVLPFPSSDVRRSDDIVIDHRHLLFGEMDIEVRNFIYASEWNPFDLYRQIELLYRRYRDLLREPLGETAMTLSCHGSKLLSLGALLAAHEFGFGVLHATPSGYYLRSGTDVAALRTTDRLFCAWVDGEPYQDACV